MSAKVLCTWEGVSVWPFLVRLRTSGEWNVSETPTSLFSNPCCCSWIGSLFKRILDSRLTDSSSYLPRGDLPSHPQYASSPCQDWLRTKTKSNLGQSDLCEFRGTRLRKTATDIVSIRNTSHFPFSPFHLINTHLCHLPYSSGPSSFLKELID